MHKKPIFLCFVMFLILNCVAAKDGNSDYVSPYARKYHLDSDEEKTDKQSGSPYAEKEQTRSLSTNSAPAHKMKKRTEPYSSGQPALETVQMNLHEDDSTDVKKNVIVMHPILFAWFVSLAFVFGIFAMASICLFAERKKLMEKIDRD